jgi:hypothetical protein
MFASEIYPSDSSEFLINQKLGALIKECKELIFTSEAKKSPDFNTEETELLTLGIIISKYCDWDGKAIKEAAIAAFCDSNFEDVKISLG